MLPSGLPDFVADDEDIARFLTSSNHFNTHMAKPAAFLPSPKGRETSVSRHGAEPAVELWAIGDAYLGGSLTIHGAAVLKAGNARAVALDVLAAEPPPRHAAIRNWPWLEDDPEMQKAKQKEMAARIASCAQLIRR